MRGQRTYRALPQRPGSRIGGWRVVGNLISKPSPDIAVALFFKLEDRQEQSIVQDAAEAYAAELNKENQ